MLKLVNAALRSAGWYRLPPRNPHGRLVREEQIALGCAVTIFSRVHFQWPHTYAGLKQILGPKFALAEGVDGPGILALAAIALQLQATPNVFPETVSTCIQHYLFQFLEKPEYIREIKMFIAAFERDVLMQGEQLESVSHRLLGGWVQEKIWDFEAIVDGQRLGVLDAIALQGVKAAISDAMFVWSWKPYAEYYVGHTIG